MSLTIAPPALQPRFTAPPAPRAAGASTDNIRPNVEWWEVGDKRYDSTADLLKGWQPGKAGEPAVYHWRQETSFGQRDFWKAAGDGAVSGALVGALCGCGFGIGVNVLGHLATVLTGGLAGVFGGFGLVAPIVVGAVGGGVIGAVSGPKEARRTFEIGNIVGGVIQPEAQPDGTSRPAFYVDGQVGDKVDLSAYATAKPGPVPPGADQPWWIRGTHDPFLG